jgi:4-hydroxy-tetrahydrodipicolinate synthase
MVTPFTASGAVDYRRAAELAIRLVEHGSSGLVVTGTTGESPTLTPEERLELYRVVKQAVGQIPVIANTGDNETAFSVEFSKQAQGTGVDALLLVVPYYSRPNQEGLFQHFKAIATAVELPCILYNVPARTARNLEASTVARLAKIPNIVGVKEASGDLTQVAHIRAHTPDDFWIYSGNDADTLPMMTLGCCGVVSVVSHVAGKPFREMIEAFQRGAMQRALDLHLQLLPVTEALFPATSPNPAPVKAGLKLQGFDCGGVRLPLVEAGAVETEALRGALVTAGLL